MRTIPILLLLTALSAGCATGLGFNRGLSDSAGTRNGVNPVAALPEEGLPRNAQPDAGTTTTTAKAWAGIRKTGRLIKCGAMGAAAGGLGSVVVAGVLVPYTGGLSIYALPVLIPFGVVVGIKGGIEEGVKQGDCPLNRTAPANVTVSQAIQQESE